VAEQHSLPFLRLPDEINLKKAELESYYRQVSVELSAGAPGQKTTQRGGSMVYGVTIPKNAPNPEAAKKFIHYLLNEEQGLIILRQMGQPTVVPSGCERYEKLPLDLRKYARPAR
jgi:molybdate/tungstate transport system substrate-binding protein